MNFIDNMLLNAPNHALLELREKIDKILCERSHYVDIKVVQLYYILGDYLLYKCGDFLYIHNYDVSIDLLRERVLDSISRPPICTVNCIKNSLQYPGVVCADTAEDVTYTLMLKIFSNRSSSNTTLELNVEIDCDDFKCIHKWTREAPLLLKTFMAEQSILETWGL